MASRRRPAKKRVAGARASGWQMRKAQITRQKIIDTTIACLVKYGYHATTYPRIAAAAGLSRGAMRYHFPTRRDVVAAAIEHLHEKRLKAFRRAAGATSSGRDRPVAGLAALWRHVNHPLFMAFIELALAAHRDRALATLLGPVQENFRRESFNTALEMFPEWADRRDQLRSAMELSQYMMVGMVLDGPEAPGDPNTKRQLDFLGRQLLVLLGSSARPTRSRT